MPSDDYPPADRPAEDDSADAPGDVPADADDSPAIASISLESGDFVLYDPNNGEAWIQSDAPVTLEARV